jgi:hypothetical protein
MTIGRVEFPASERVSLIVYDHLICYSAQRPVRMVSHFDYLYLLYDELNLLQEIGFRNKIFTTVQRKAENLPQIPIFDPNAEIQAKSI